MTPARPVHHILVLDDDELLRGLLETLLSLEGYHVTLASAGEEALQRLRAGLAPDLVLSDIHMPGLEGEALATTLRGALPPHVLFIGMSASEPGPQIRALFDAFLPKPFDLPAFAAALRSAQTRQTLHGATASEPETGARRNPETGASRNPETGDGAGRVPSAPPPLDETIFQALAKAIPAPQLGQLYAMTLADIAKRHARMVTAAAAGDQPTLQREAHTIKGSCGFVGASELQAVAAALETATTPDPSSLDEIPAACLRLRSMLKSKLQSA